MATPAPINPAELAKPSGFTHAVVHDGLVHLAGQTALDGEGRIVPGGVVEQFHRALSNVLTALRAAGGSSASLLSVTIYLRDIPDYQAHTREVGRVWRELVGGDYPAVAAVGVAVLWQPEALVEIQATGAVGA